MSKNRRIQLGALILSSILGIGLNLIIGFIIPNIITYGDYAAYKIYTFYIGYLPILHMGITDGLLLKYSKYAAEELKQFDFRKSFIRFSMFQVLISIVMLLFGLGTGRLNICYVAIILTIPLINIVSYTDKLLIIYEKFKIISFCNLLIKLLTVLAVILMVVFNVKRYEILILTVMIAYAIQIIIGYFAVRNKVFHDSGHEKIAIDVKELILIGMPIVIVYFVNNLVLGLDRIFIQKMNNEYEYAMYSFAYSLITIFITVLNSINVVILPSIMKMNKESRVRYYIESGKLLNILMGFLGVFMVLMTVFINIIIPKYNDSVAYFYLLFPVVFLKLQYSLKIWPHINAIGKIKKVFVVTCIVLLVSYILNIVVYYLNLDLKMYAVMTVISMYLLNAMMEFIVRKHEGIKKDKCNTYEAMIIIGITLTYYSFDYLRYVIFVAITIFLTIYCFSKDFKRYMEVIKRRMNK